MIEQGYDSKYGARPLRRTLQNKVEDRLAEEILDGNIRSGDQVHVELEEGELKFSVPEKLNSAGKNEGDVIY